MKRRDFLRTTAALAATPALPARAIAGGLAVSADDYARAVSWVHKWTMTSASAVKSAFGLDQTAAEALFEQLQHDGVLQAANGQGIAKATNPWFKDPMTLARAANSLGPNAKPGTELRKRLQSALETTKADNADDQNLRSADHPDPGAEADPSGPAPDAQIEPTKTDAP